MTPAQTPMSHLFSPCPIGPLTLENRIVIPPMCQYAGTEGCASTWHLIHFGNMVLSGAGLFIIEATAVEPRGRITPFDLGLWSDETEAALAKALAPARAVSNMPIGIQLAHAGRKASTARPWDGGRVLSGRDELGWIPVAPSPIPFRDGDPTPETLDVADIEELVEAFVAAGLRAARLGLDLVELHAAHGYLLHEFLSPLSNYRQDEFGGPLENRMRLTLRIFEALKRALPSSLPLGVRLSATDWIEGGWSLEESLVLAQRLEALGADFIHVSSGGLAPTQKIALGPGYQVPFAQAIHQATRLKTIAVGLIKTPAAAEAILERRQADLIGVARAMIHNPRWPLHAAQVLSSKMTLPGPVWRCVPDQVADLFSPRDP